MKARSEVSVLYQAGLMYAIRVCNAVSGIHNQLRNSLIRIFGEGISQAPGQEILRKLARANPLLDYILSQMNPLHIPTRCLTPCVVRSFIRARAHVSRLYRTTDTAILFS